ncbi:MAG: hypothetical protein P8Z30_15660 [Acidobacteriota bacterium]
MARDLPHRFENPIVPDAAGRNLLLHHLVPRFALGVGPLKRRDGGNLGWTRSLADVNGGR